MHDLIVIARQIHMIQKDIYSVSTLQEISYLHEILLQKGKIQDEGNSQEI